MVNGCTIKGFNDKAEAVKTGVRRCQDLNFKRSAFNDVTIMNDIKRRSIAARNVKFIIKFLQNHKSIISAKQWRQRISSLKIVGNSIKMIWVRMGQKNGLRV